MKLNNINNRKLKDASLTKVETEEWDDEYRLCLVYEEVDDFGNIHEVTLKDILLPLYEDFKFRGASSADIYECPRMTIDVGYGDVILCDPSNSITDTIVKYASPKEMTLEEIEEKLGHKVKIVSREDG